MDRGRAGWRRRMPLVAVLGVCLGGPLASATEPPAPLHDLVWVDLTGMSPAVVGLASSEVGDLLAPLGVRVVSRIETPGVAFPTGHAIVILRRSNPNPAHTGRSVGGTVTEAAATSRTLWVFPACVASGLGLTLEHQLLWSSGQRREFARALAVVVAHELQHLAGAHHSPGGLMSGSLCPSQLRDRHLELDTRLAPGFKAALAARTHPVP